MNELSQILAVIVVVTHCAAIFWPRKPLDVDTDENGLPAIWRNDDGQSKDVTCVWARERDDVSAVQTVASQESATPVAACSREVTSSESQRAGRIV